MKQKRNKLGMVNDLNDSSQHSVIYITFISLLL